MLNSDFLFDKSHKKFFFKKLYYISTSYLQPRHFQDSLVGQQLEAAYEAYIYA